MSTPPQRTRCGYPQRVLPVITAAALAVLVTGCSGDGEPGPKSSTSKATAAPTSAPPSPTEAPKKDVMSFGDTFHFEDTFPGQGEVKADVTVLTYTQPAKADFKPSDVSAGGSGDEWTALEVKVCSAQGTIEASENPWQLATADGRRFESRSASGGPKPEFPMGGAKLASRDCVRGNIMFAVPKGQRPQSAVYAPSSIPTPQKWAIPAT